jgi:hypothetical protein
MGWRGLPPKSFFAPIRESAMEKFIHRENLTLFKKRLAEPHSDAERKVLLKLLADEETKEPPQKNGIFKPRESASNYIGQRPLRSSV